MLFKGTACSDHKSVKEIISEVFEGLRNGKGSSQFLPSDDISKEFDIRDAAGKETYWQLLPQWGRLVIAGVNFASYNGLVQLPEFPQPQF